jgi:hypothetical protein
MMHKAKVAVCSEIRKKHLTQSEHYVEILNVNPSAWSDGPCPHDEYFPCSGVTGSARLLHGLTHSIISRKQRKNI